MIAPLADSGELTILAAIQEYICTLERAANSFEKAHSDFKEKILAHEAKMHKELKELRDEVEMLCDKMKEGRDKKNRKRRACIAEGIEEIEEETRKSKRRRVKIQGYDCNLTIWLG